MPTEYQKPLPKTTPVTEFFWEGCKQHELRIQICKPCNEYYFYPRAFCPRCWSTDVEWRTVSGQGSLATYLINYRPTPPFADDAPFVIAIVELAEGPHLMSNLVNVEPKPENLPVGLPLEVVFDDVTDSITLPKFQPKVEA